MEKLDHTARSNSLLTLWPESRGISLQRYFGTQQGVGDVSGLEALRTIGEYEVDEQYSQHFWTNPCMIKWSLLGRVGVLDEKRWHGVIGLEGGSFLPETKQSAFLPYLTTLKLGTGFLDTWAGANCATPGVFSFWEGTTGHEN